VPRLRPVTAVTGWNNLSASRCFAIVNTRHFRRRHASGLALGFPRGSLESGNPLKSFACGQLELQLAKPACRQDMGRSKTGLSMIASKAFFERRVALAVTPDGCWHGPFRTYDEALSEWRWQ